MHGAATGLTTCQLTLGGGRCGPHSWGTRDLQPQEVIAWAPVAHRSLASVPALLGKGLKDSGPSLPTFQD